MKISQKYPKTYFGLLNSFLYFLYPMQIVKFRTKNGYFPNIAFPKLYHEKMLWRKIFDHNPMFTIFSDKIATKTYVSKLIPDVKIPATLWAGKNAQQIPAELFQQDGLIKANHGSNFNYFFKKDALDLKKIQQLGRKWMGRKYGRKHLQWGYFNVDRTLFIEEMIPTGSHKLIDLSMSCVDGEVVYVRVVTDSKTPQRKSMFFDLEGNRIYALNFNPDHDFPFVDAVCPTGLFFDAIVKAKILSKGVDFARVDFMTNGIDLYGGEITVYPNAGFSRVSSPGEMGQDNMVNPVWDLKKSWFLSNPQGGWRGRYANNLKTLI